MAKAHLRDDDGDFPVERPPPQTADQLEAEIGRLYHTLPAFTGLRPTPAYLALEAQIRALARRHWALTSGIILPAEAPPMPARPHQYTQTSDARAPGRG